jgi:hypothetical protein
MKHGPRGSSQRVAQSEEYPEFCPIMNICGRLEIDREEHDLDRD